jgi:hypothetical protein
VSEQAGEGHRTDPLTVLTSIVSTEPAPPASATAQAEEAETKRVSVQTAIERFAAEAEMVYTVRTAATLDRLATDGTLTPAQRQAFAGEATDTATLARLLRTAELAGHDPDHVLATAVRSRDFDGARSLPQVLYRRIERQLAGRLAPTSLRYAEMVPAVTSPAWREQLTSRAEAADSRRRTLGEAAAIDPPQWAAEALGPVPAEPVARLDWEHRAGTVAAWRELAGHADPADALGSAPRPGKPEHYATWRAAWTALGRPEADRADAELSDGALRVRVRAYERELAWAPSYVGESLTATSLAADARRRVAVLTAARADAAKNERLRGEAADEAALADTLAARVADLEAADAARSKWLVHTAVTRDAAERAEAELASRGIPRSADADDAVTADEWLAAHQAEQTEADEHRMITEHDIAGDASVVGIPEARELPAEELVDEPGRVPDATETAIAVRRAQAALAEIEQRRTLDERRAQDERRATQLTQWATEDADVADRADAAVR